jgi:hypothetical protein
MRILVACDIGVANKFLHVDGVVNETWTMLQRRRYFRPTMHKAFQAAI